MLKYFKLFRWLNLLIIILTQYLMRFTLLEPLMVSSGYTNVFSGHWFELMVISTVFIAIGGYIANDIADIEIDKLNRPYRPIATGEISPGQAKVFQLFFEIGGLILGFLAAWMVGNAGLVVFHLLILVLLRYYAASLKCKGLAGNLAVSFASAMVPLLTLVFTVYALYTSYGFASMDYSSIKLVGLFYTGFAFWFTLIREIVKDLEDLRGDKQLNCRTLAVRMPLQRLKYTLQILSFVGLNGILMFQFMIYKYMPEKILFSANFASLDVIILFLVIPKLITANSSHDFQKIGNTLKIIMAAGILFMLFLRF